MLPSSIVRALKAAGWNVRTREVGGRTHYFANRGRRRLEVIQEGRIVDAFIDRRIGLSSRLGRNPLLRDVRAYIA